MATAKKAAPKKKAVSKEKGSVTKKSAKASEVVSVADMDRKSLAARAREIKVELLAIRFNLQAPSLKEYRRKRAELRSVLGQLGA